MYMYTNKKIFTSAFNVTFLEYLIFKKLIKKMSFKFIS